MMHNVRVVATAATHQLFDGLLGVVGRRRPAGEVIAEPSDERRDRGAVSLEQVLWFVAAGVSVAVIATLLWNAIRDEAETDIVPPQAPTTNS